MTSRSELDLPALEALHHAATPGPWVSSRAFTRGVGGVALWAADGDCIAEVQGRAPDADARLVAALRSHAPELLRLARIGQLVEDTYARVAKEADPK